MTTPGKTIGVGASFRGAQQSTRYNVANDAAMRAGNLSMIRARRNHWNLEDFDAARIEFERVLDNLTLGMPAEDDGEGGGDGGDGGGMVQ